MSKRKRSEDGETKLCEEGSGSKRQDLRMTETWEEVTIDLRDAALARDLLTLSTSTDNRTLDSRVPSHREIEGDSRSTFSTATSSTLRPDDSRQTGPGLFTLNSDALPDRYKINNYSLAQAVRPSHTSLSTAMTPTPPTTNSSTGASPDNGQFRVVRKRNRIPLSCAPCRHRKLKCNRGHPCDNCTKRGDTTSCVYASPTTRKKPGIHHVPTGTPDDMQNRIDRLESLVLSLMTNGSQAAGPSAAHAAITSSRSNSLGTSMSMPLDPHRDSIREEGEDSDINDVAQDIGIMKIDGAKAFFVPDAHWYAILSDIAEVKNYFASHKEQYQEQFRKVQASKSDDVSGSFLFKGPRLNNKTEVLVTMPDKNAVDDLVKRYFQSYDPAVHIIHGPTFQGQYDRHWQNPNETPVTFLALLYGMMTLALQSYTRAGDEPPEYQGRSHDMSVSFKRLTAQCIVLADVTQPLPQLVEALILHIQAEHSSSNDAETGILLLVNLCTRLAMRMGYHRDSGPYPNVSPFTAEMRRRVWAFVRQADLLFSCQFGLPPVVRFDSTDSDLPNNIFDDEFTEDMKTLPPSRPESEVTPASYMIAKARLISCFGQIVDRIQSVTAPPSYEEIMKLDALLREARTSIPPHLQMKPPSELAMAAPNLIMQTYALELIYLKSQCMLHRKFIARGRDSPRYAYSRRTCIDASMEMLTHQATLYIESRDGGKLRSVKWSISSLTTHDFLLAAMIVCLDLYHTTESDRNTIKTSSSDPSSPMGDVWTQDRRDQMITSLQHCASIWESLRDKSMEAYKASTQLRVMLGKIRAQEQQQTVMTGGREQQLRSASQYGMRGQSFGSFTSGQVSDIVDDEVPPEHSAAMTLGLLSSGGVSPNAGFASNNPASLGMDARGYPASMAGLLNEPMSERTGLTPQYSGVDVNGVQAVQGAVSPFTQMFGAGAPDVDWGAWDSYVQGDPMQMWSMNLEVNPLDGQQAQQQQAAQHQAQQQLAQQAQQASMNNMFMGPAGAANMM
ncbi:hypothetical protein E4T47_01551 [Aureobasidium subglaciale]|nr:hypothetical protein E4T47_01551 [Aureobasidium subglaciale]